MIADLVFNPADHTFTYGGLPVPSVTRILHHVMGTDTRWYTEESRKRGSAVHLFCQQIDEGWFDKAKVPAELWGYVQAYLGFVASSKWQPIIIEEPVYNPALRYAGIIDRFGILNGERVVIDLKTGYPTAVDPLQTAAYSMCLDERPAKRFNLYLRKNSTCKLEPRDDDDDYRTFEDAARIYHWREQHKLLREVA